MYTLRKAAAADFDSVKAAYVDIAENTPDMARYARYEYGKHPKDSQITEYIDQGNLYMFMDGEQIAGVIVITPYQSEVVSSCSMADQCPGQ